MTFLNSPGFSANGFVTPCHRVEGVNLGKGYSMCPVCQQEYDTYASEYPGDPGVGGKVDDATGWDVD